MSVRVRQRGLALVTAVLVVALAATIAAFLAFGQQLWLRQMENMADRARTDFLERGALAWGLIALDEDKDQGVDHLGEDWARPLPPLPVPGGVIRASVEDAQGRFNLNNLWQNNLSSMADVESFGRLLESLRLDPELRWALLDWIDPNPEVTPPGGAEDIDYLQLNPPYRAANQPLSSVDELRLVRGFSAEVVETLRPYVTVMPGHTDINVNTAPAPVIAALIPGLSSSQASTIIANRETNPFRDKSNFDQRLSAIANTKPATGYGVMSNHFLVMLDIAIGRHYRRVEALVQRQSGGQGKLIWHRTRPVLAPSDETERTR